MKYVDFEHIMSSARMSRYIKSCNGDTRKAMTLYRKNLNLSQELFTTISCFEIALRNRIDRHYLSFLGNDWLRNASGENGIFDHSKCRYAARIIRAEIEQLQESYSHSKLVAALGFGFWRYLFSPHQYRAGGKHFYKCFHKSQKVVDYNILMPHLFLNSSRRFIKSEIV